MAVARGTLADLLRDIAAARLADKELLFPLDNRAIAERGHHPAQLADPDAGDCGQLGIGDEPAAPGALAQGRGQPLQPVGTNRPPADDPPPDGGVERGREARIDRYGPAMSPATRHRGCGTAVPHGP